MPNFVSLFPQFAQKALPSAWFGHPHWVQKVGGATMAVFPPNVSVLSPLSGSIIVLPAACVGCCMGGWYMSSAMGCFAGVSLKNILYIRLRLLFVLMTILSFHNGENDLTIGIINNRYHNHTPKTGCGRSQPYAILFGRGILCCAFGIV